MNEPIVMQLKRRGLAAGAFSASVLSALGSLVPDAHAAADSPPARSGAVSTPGAIKAIEGFANSLAVQAAIYAVPIVAMYLLRQTVCFGPAPKARPNEIWRIRDIATPQIAEQAGYVSPNVNVVYGFGFMDLDQQPVILRAPDSQGRYYMIELCDMWTNAFAYPAGKHTGYKGGTFALVGPGWKGSLPAGITRIDCPTRWVEVQPRVYVKDAADLPAAEAVLAGVTTTGLAQYTGAPPLNPSVYGYAAPRIDPKVASSMMQFSDPLQFWEIFAAAMNENPPPTSEIQALLPQFRYLGIELGRQWKRNDVRPAVRDAMQEVAGRIGPLTIGAGTLISRVTNGWELPPIGIGDPGGDYLVRAVIAVAGLTANTATEASTIRPWPTARASRRRVRGATR